MVSKLEERFIELQLEMISDSALVRWAVGELVADQATAKNPDICELASLPEAPPSRCSSAGSLLRAAVRRDHPRFDLSSPEAESHARGAFGERCKRLVAGEIGPAEFCRAICPIEQAFDYPVWLGDFYNHCDWCEAESTREEFSHLIEYAQAYAQGVSEEF